MKGAARLVEDEILAGGWRSGPAAKNHAERRGTKPCLGAGKGGRVLQRRTRHRGGEPGVANGGRALEGGAETGGPSAPPVWSTARVLRS